MRNCAPGEGLDQLLTVVFGLETTGGPKRKLRKLIGDVRPRGGLVLAVLAGVGGTALLAVLAYALRNVRPGELLDDVPVEALAILALGLVSYGGNQQLRQAARDRVRRWAERRYGADRLTLGAAEQHTTADRLDDLSIPQLLRRACRAKRRKQRRNRAE